MSMSVSGDQIGTSRLINQQGEFYRTMIQINTNEFVKKIKSVVKENLIKIKRKFFFKILILINDTKEIT